MVLFRDADPCLVPTERRAKIALLGADDVSNKEIAITLGLSGVTISKWRQRFSRYRTSVLDDAPGSGTPKTHNDEKIAEIIRVTTTTEPKNATHWSTTEVAKMAGKPSLHEIQLKNGSCLQTLQPDESPSGKTLGQHLLSTFEFAELLEFSRDWARTHIIKLTIRSIFTRSHSVCLQVRCMGFIDLIPIA